MSIVLGVIGLLFAFFGYLIKYKKMYGLISGYNTTPKSKRENIDIESIANIMGNCSIGLAFTSIIFIGLELLGLSRYVWIYFVILFIFVVYMIIASDKYDYNKKKMVGKYSLQTIVVTVFIVIVGLFVSTMILIGRNENTVIFESDYLKIDGMYSTVIKYNEIESLSLLDHVDLGGKTNGFNFPPVNKGYFNVKDLGNGLVYLNTDYKPIIYIKCHDRFILINFKDKNKTSDIYNKILEILNR